MQILSFIIHLFSGALLLLFAVRFMRVGIERQWGGGLQSRLRDSAGTVSLLAKGGVLGFVLQGATVVMLMAAGLVGSNTIPMVSAVLLAMGADLGSALAVQVLTLPISAIGPLLLVIGGWLYLNSAEAGRRNIGRVILGLGLIFLSLRLIREAVEPLQALQNASGVIGALNADPVTAAICGLVLTLLMHSSLAAILTGLAFAAHGALGPVAGLGFVLGCNLGSALLPLWLLRNEAGPGLAVARIVASLRCGLGVVLTAGLALAGEQLAEQVELSAHDAMLGGHLGFNLFLLLLAPLARRMAGRAERRDATGAHARFTLPADTSDPTLIVVALKTQVGRMLEILSTMFARAISHPPNAEGVREAERQLNTALAETRNAFAGLPELPERQAAEVQNALEFSIRLERCGDMISGKFLEVRQQVESGEYRFTAEGAAEIDGLMEALDTGLLLARNVLWTEDEEAARQLVLHKQRVTGLEQQSRNRHLQRVGSGNLTSLSSSNQHLELIAAVKEINSKLATVGYAVLERQGQLEATRLKPTETTLPPRAQAGSQN
ncbi:Na/Pi symporter [uncultured Paracoccus sp.]|uniref:Na/Pi cotransporter family protein n=1 Tax=uncultured Paracoccus sp. TaxID=189685 RepID=UPI00260B1EA3|nr:Na/Pi symporter [uncultured Paracoccus sp.]